MDDWIYQDADETFFVALRELLAFGSPSMVWNFSGERSLFYCLE